MAKNNKKEEFATEQFVEKLDRTAFNVEFFVEKYAKAIGIGLGVIIVAVLGYFAYLKLVVEPKSEDAFIALTTGTGNCVPINASTRNITPSHLYFFIYSPIMQK